MLTVLLSALAASTSPAPSGTAPPLSEPTRYWVYFADKGLDEQDQARALADLAGTYGDRAIERRLKRRSVQGLFDSRDLPVAPSNIHAVESAGATIHQQSRWLNAVSVRADAQALGRIGSLPGVTRVEPVRGGRANRPEETTFTPDPFSARDEYGASSDQLNQINLPAVHADWGLRGRGVIIGILDTGFVTTHRAFNEPGYELAIVAAHDFVRGDSDVGIEPGDDPDQHRHGTWILGCISAYWPNVLVGGAPEASVVLCKTEDYASETPIEEDNYVAGLEFAEQHGADLCTSSLGYIDWYTQADLDGATAVTTIAVNIATQNGMYCVTAAGNEGHDNDPATSHLIAPADGLEVITCGAVDWTGATAGFSSDGPTADGRVKPEVLARGVDTVTVSSRSDTELGTVSGTSLSTPLVAAALACRIGGEPCSSIDQMRNRLFASQTQPDPLGVRGYGVLDAAAILVDEGCADYNGDGFLDFFDYDDYVSCFQGVACPCGRTADFNGDDFIDFFDYDDFVAAFETGC